jgi:hypothetical protein
MPRDYYVGARSEVSIAEIAERLRDAHCSRNDHTFNTVEFVEKTLPAQLKGSKKGKLVVEFYEQDFKEDDPAYVTFDPLKLHVDATIWADARFGEGYAREIIGHEIGHLTLHNHDAKAFSNDKSAQLAFADDEQSAEWQANTFMDYFLVPDRIVQELREVGRIAALCQVTGTFALRRVVSLKRKEFRKKRVFEGDYCDNCGCFSLVRTGTLLRCTTFGCPKIVSWL